MINRTRIQKRSHYRFVSFIMLSLLISLLIFPSLYFLTSLESKSGVNYTPFSANPRLNSQADTPTPLWFYNTGEAVYSVAISPDGQYIAAGTQDRVLLWNRNSSTPLWSFYTGDFVYAVTFSSDGNYIASAGGILDHPGDLYLWHRTSATPIWNFTGAGNFASVAISTDATYLTAGDRLSNELCFWKTDNTTPLWTYTATDGNWEDVALSADGMYLAACDGFFHDYVYLFNTSNSDPVWSYHCGADVWSVDITPDGEYITAASKDQKVYLWDQSSNNTLWNYTTNHEVGPVSISDDGAYIAAGSVDTNVYFFENPNSTPQWAYSTEGIIRPPQSVAISANGQFIAAGSADSAIYFFGRDNSTPRWNYSTSLGTIQSVALSDSGLYLVAGGDDQSIYVFETYDPSDEFDSPTLDVKWTWTNGGSNATYSLSDTPGTLAINCTCHSHKLESEGISAIPHIWQYAPNTDFNLTVKVNIPDANEKGVGIILYDSTSNTSWFSLSNYRDSIGSTVHFQRADGITTYNLGMWRISPNYLRIVKNSTLISIYYSFDGNNWTYLEQCICSSYFFDRMGLYGRSTYAGDFLAEIDYFRFNAQTTDTEGPFGSNYILFLIIILIIGATLVSTSSVFIISRRKARSWDESPSKGASKKGISPIAGMPFPKEDDPGYVVVGETVNLSEIMDQVHSLTISDPEKEEIIAELLSLPASERAHFLSMIIDKGSMDQIMLELSKLMKEIETLEKSQSWLDMRQKLNLAIELADTIGNQTLFNRFLTKLDELQSR